MSNLKDPRVLFAAERTLLAWTRTSLALVAFGFVVERAGMLIRAISADAVHPHQATATFWLGLSFIVLGSIASACAARQYAVVLHSLTPEEFPPGYRAKWGLITNFALTALGLTLAGVLWLWR